MLTKQQFENKMLENLDEMYTAYVAAEEAVENVSEADRLLASRDNLPSFTASDPVLSDEEKETIIEDLKTAQNVEKVMFTVGKVALAVAIKAYAA